MTKLLSQEEILRLLDRGDFYDAVPIFKCLELPARRFIESLQQLGHDPFSCCKGKKVQIIRRQLTHAFGNILRRSLTRTDHKEAVSALRDYLNGISKKAVDVLMVKFQTETGEVITLEI